ncbi:MAG: hypothetical protein WBI18_03420 [Candidatus Saccharicenans sp.]
MKKKALSFLVMILIAGGMVMGVMNFSVGIYASPPSTIYGTVTPGTTYLASWWELNGRYLYTEGGVRYYCVWEPTKCCIVAP